MATAGSKYCLTRRPHAPTHFPHLPTLLPHLLQWRHAVGYSGFDVLVDQQHHRCEHDDQFKDAAAQPLGAYGVGAGVVDLKGKYKRGRGREAGGREQG